MPARLLFPTEVRRGVRVIDGVTFDYVLFLTPHRLSPEDHALIIDILTGGKHLGLTRELIEDRLRGREYSAVGKVTNRDAPDSAHVFVTRFDFGGYPLVCMRAVRSLPFVRYPRIKIE